MSPTQTRKAHQAFMHKANKEAKYFSIKCSVQLETLYTKWDKLIQILGKHFPVIEDEY